MAREAHDLRELLLRDCLDVIQPDVALAGGITGVRRVAELAQSRGVIFTPHTWTNGMGVVANAHLAAGLGGSPFLEFPYDPPEWSLARRDFPMLAPLRGRRGGLAGARPGAGPRLRGRRGDAGADADRLAGGRHKTLATPP